MFAPEPKPSSATRKTTTSGSSQSRFNQTTKAKSGYVPSGKMGRISSSRKKSGSQKRSNNSSKSPVVVLRANTGVHNKANSQAFTKDVLATQRTNYYKDYEFVGGVNHLKKASSPMNRSTQSRGSN